MKNYFPSFWTLMSMCSIILNIFDFLNLNILLGSSLYWYPPSLVSTSPSHFSCNLSFPRGSSKSAKKHHKSWRLIFNFRSISYFYHVSKYLLILSLLISLLRSILASERPSIIAAIIRFMTIHDAITMYEKKKGMDKLVPQRLFPISI